MLCTHIDVTAEAAALHLGQCCDDISYGVVTPSGVENGPFDEYAISADPNSGDDMTKRAKTFL